tara:strand:- start:1147 stop:1845 length:699 start_codon:yes stop_codon:yes gene_type:complete
MYSINYLKKINAFRTSSKLLGIDVNDILENYKNLNFSQTKISKYETFKQILEKKLSTDTYNFLNEKGNLFYYKDSRSGYEYLTDLVLGWLLEDAVLIKFQQLNISSSLNGTDQFREFLSDNKISAKPDIRIIGNIDRTLEIMADWKNTWKKYNHADLRDDKFMKLLHKDSLILGIAPLDGLGFIINLPDDKNIFRRNYIRAYQKYGYTVDNIKDFLFPLEEIFNKLLNIIKH